MAAAVRKRRKELELRPIRIEQGLVDGHDGSALFAFGPHAALAAVSGPSEVRIRDERTDRAALQIHFTPLQSVAGTSAMAFEQALSGAWAYALQLHLYPRGLMQIHLQTYAGPAVLAPRPINRHGRAASLLAPPPEQIAHPDAAIPVALKAAHINATTLACLDAATNMRCLVASASAAVTRKGIRANQMRGWRAGETDAAAAQDDVRMAGDEDEEGGVEILLDPSPYEESVAQSTHVFAFAFELGPGQDDEDLASRMQGKLLYNESAGRQRGSEYFDCLSLCREACKDIVLQIRQHVAQRLVAQ